MLQPQDLCTIQGEQSRQTKLDSVAYSQVTKGVLERPEPLPSDRNDFYSSVDTRVERSLLGEVQNDVEIVCRVAGLGRRKRGAGGILGEGFDLGHDRDPPFPVWAAAKLSWAF
jgi:hypothetical protein